MARSKTPLNIANKPGVGMSYLLLLVATGEYYRCSTLCAKTRHAERGDDAIEGPPSVFSGEDPYFWVKIGSKKTGFEYGKMLCGVKHSECLSEGGKWKWTDISLKEGRERGLIIVNDRITNKKKVENTIDEPKVEEVSAPEPVIDEPTKVAEESGMTKKPKKLKKTHYGIIDGKIVSKRSTRDDLDGFSFKSREEAEKSIAATV